MTLNMVKSLVKLIKQQFVVNFLWDNVLFGCLIGLSKLLAPKNESQFPTL